MERVAVLDIQGSGKSNEFSVGWKSRKGLSSAMINEGVSDEYETEQTRK